MLNSPLYWRTFYCLQSQGIVKYQALLVFPKFSYLAALLWKIRTLFMPSYTIFSKKPPRWRVLNSPLCWRTFYCLQTQGIVKYQALQVSPKFSYLVALLWKIRTRLCPVTGFSLKSTTVEGVEFSIVLKDFLPSTITGYSEVPSPAGFLQNLGMLLPYCEK